MSTRRLFDEATAVAKIGRRIHTLVEFSGVPRDTAGQVIRADPSDGGYTLAIQWELAERRAKPLVDWFTQDEYEQFLVEVQPSVSRMEKGGDANEPEERERSAEAEG